MYKVILILPKFFMKYERMGGGGQIDPPPPPPQKKQNKKTALKKPSLIRVKVTKDLKKLFLYFSF